ncbi:MAG: aminoglycoside phosphotransferase [Frankiales bacterium]|nr:aminoglycoside phosphotransferase [Frankiales bacterium]
MSLLVDWLPRQRWFGAKGRDITSVAQTSAVVLSEGDPEITHAIIQVSFGDGGEEAYQLLLGRTKQTVEQRLEYAVIGEDDGYVLYDAVHDPFATGLLLQHLAAGDEFDGLSFVNADELDPALPGRLMTAEQSNTSIVYGDQLILKLFRRLQPGANPDIEVTKALSDAGCTTVARPMAWFDGTVAGETTTLGLLQPFLHNSSEGWAMATASVRDLFAEADLHADEVGGDFAGESERLGFTTGEVHLLMARALPFATAGPEDSAESAQQMNDRLDAALAAVPELEPLAAGLRDAYSRIAHRTQPVAVQRIHGDYHLGQVLRTQESWVLLDFEGEPARPLAERRALMSPLRDVAGMLRSFDYAARHLLAERADQRHLAYRAQEWAERNREAFCDGYARAVGADPRDEAELLRAFELDKAVYEVVYEARNRPTWLQVPLGSIARLVGVSA